MLCSTAFRRSLFAALVAAFLLTSTAFSADIAGAWKWTTEGRNDPMPSTAKLALKDQVAFTVTREFYGYRFAIEHAGKVEGDTFNGPIERPNREGSTSKVKWKAARVK